jgi:hypothetical protein
VREGKVVGQKTEDRKSESLKDRKSESLKDRKPESLVSKIHDPVLLFHFETPASGRSINEQ